MEMAEATVEVKGDGHRQRWQQKVSGKGNEGNARGYRNGNGKGNGKDNGKCDGNGNHNGNGAANGNGRGNGKGERKSNGNVPVARTVTATGTAK